MTTPAPVGETIASWQQAGESHDAERAAACLAPAVEIISPLTAQFRFRGRDQGRDVLAAAFQVIDSIEYHTATGDGLTHALFYHGRCGAEEFEEAQLLRFAPDGLITELTLFGRPLPGVTAVMAGIGPVMLRHQRRRGMSRLIAAAVAPMAFMSRVGDRFLVPLADPSRAHRR